MTIAPLAGDDNLTTMTNALGKIAIVDNTNTQGIKENSITLRGETVTLKVSESADTQRVVQNNQTSSVVPYPSLLL